MNTSLPMITKSDHSKEEKLGGNRFELSYNGTYNYNGKQSDGKYHHPLRKWLDKLQYNSTKQFTKRRMFLFIITLLYAIILWAIIIYKQFNEDFLGVFKYYTNISLLLQAIFYTLYLFIFFEDPIKRTLEQILLVGVSLIILSQVTVVFILVLGVILKAPQLIIDQTKTGGGKYDDGIVLFGERVYHVFPGVFALIFFPSIWSDIVDCAIMSFAYCIFHTGPREKTIEEIYPNSSKTNRVIIQTLKEHGVIVTEYNVDNSTVLFYFISIYLLSCAPFLLYMMVIDLQDQYDLPDSWAIWPPIIGVFLICIFSVGIPVAFIFYSGIPSRYLYEPKKRNPMEYVQYNTSNKEGILKIPANKLDISFPIQ